jgi:hypothetical protein
VESPRNHQERMGRTPNHPRIAWNAGRRRVGKKRIQMSSQGVVKAIYTQGHQTCPVEGLDLSGETSDRTCPIWARLVW